MKSINPVSLACLFLCCVSACDAAETQGGRIELSPKVRAKCLSVLRKAVRSDEFWPSMHAAEALSLGGYGDEVRNLLEPKLKTEKDDQHRCGLARELVRAGDRSKTAIMFRILAGKNDFGHIHACESLFKVNAIGDGRLFLRAMRQDKNPRLALMAAAALGRWGSPEALALLRQHLNHEDHEVARIAAWILARIGDDSDIPRLKKRLKTITDPLSRAYFEHALATLGDKNGLAALERNLTHKDPVVRIYAATFAGDARAVGVKDKLIALLDHNHVDVRVRAAQSLLVLARPAPLGPGDVVVRDVFKATAKNPRYSEGSIIPLHDGSFLYATTEFVGSGSDFATAQIIASKSTDGGRTWSRPRVLQRNIGKRNVMSVTLRRLGPETSDNAPIGLFYLVKNSFSDLRVFLRISHDEAETFGKAIAVSSVPGYHVMNNDRVTRLTSGRLLAPVASTEDVRKVNHFVSFCFLSDDNGKTWRKGKGHVDYAKRGAMEPEVIEMDNGRVLMILRTQLGHIAYSESKDGGETWSKAKSWNVKAPEAPATLRRIPSTGDLLLIWNDTFTKGAGHGGKRTPLTAAISTDGGKTWKHKRQLETDAAHTYAYTSVAFTQGRALLSYYVRDEKTGRISSRFRSVPIGWFYSH